MRVEHKPNSDMMMDFSPACDTGPLLVKGEMVIYT